MATLGLTGEPTSSAEAWAGTNNSIHAIPLTMPAGGPWRITHVAVWAAGYGVNTTARNIAWRADTGAILVQSADYTLTARTFTASGSDLYNKAVTGALVAGGFALRVGFQRSESGSSGAFFGKLASGTHYDKLAASYPDDFVGASAHADGAMGVYITYELAASVPSAPALTSPTSGTETSDTTPTLAFTHIDADGDSIVSYDLQVDATSGNGVAPDWTGLAYEVVSGTTDDGGAIGGDDSISQTTSALARGQWYAWRARTNDGTGDGAWSAVRYFKIVDVPTATDCTPADDGFAFIHNLGSSLAVWTSGGTDARPRLQFVYSCPDGHQMNRRVIRIYTAGSGGSAAHTSDVSETVADGGTVTYDATYGMLNKNQASSERFWTVQAYCTGGENSGEVNPDTGAAGSRASFKVCWGQAKYEYNAGVGTSGWQFSSAGVQAGTQVAFIYGSTASAASSPSVWKTSVGAVTVDAWFHVLVRLSSHTVGTNPSLADMTFQHAGGVSQPDKWKSNQMGEIVLDTDERRYGQKSLKVNIASGTAGNRYLYPYRYDGDDDDDDEVQVLPETEYTASVFIKTESPLTGGNLRLRISRPFSSTDTLAETASVTDTSSYPNGWQRLTLTYTSEAGMYLVRPVVVYTRNSGVTESYWVDAMLHEPGTVATPWHPSLVGESARIDVGGIMIDALHGGILRLRGTSGDPVLDVVELGAHGLRFGGTTDLYSPAGDILQTDDQLRSARTSGTDVAVSGKRTADSNNRWQFTADGVLGIGAGSGAVDTTLQRGAADLWQFNDPIRLPLVSDVAAKTTEGAASWDNTIRSLYVGDADVARPVTPVGYAAWAFPPGMSWFTSPDTGVTMAAGASNTGGSVLVPIVVDAAMFLEECAFFSTEASLARTGEWRLYVERQGDSSTIDHVPDANGTFSYTGSVSTWRFSACQSPPVLLPPGWYWLVFHNTHATNTWVGAASPTTTGAPTTFRNIANGAALGSTLDTTDFTGTSARTFLAALVGSAFNEGVPYG